MSQFYYVTTYALTRGVLRVPSDRCEESDGYLYVKSETLGQAQIGRQDWFKDEETAFRRAERLRSKKLDSLAKSIKRVEKICFKPVVDW